MGARMKSVTTAEIAYFMADGKYLHLVTHDGKDYIVDRTLTEVGENCRRTSFSGSTAVSSSPSTPSGR